MSRISTLATALALALTMQAQAHAQTAATPAADQGAAARPDTGTISGVVSDAGRGGYLAGAEVRISGLNVVAVSASDGSFTLHRVPAGRHELTVSYIGRPDRQQAVDVTGGQTTQAAVAVGMGNDATTLDEIVVRAAPIAESEYAALQAQRASVSLVNVIAADSIGRFPDQNVAASLSRLPGIAVERDQGQERYVNLRGAPARWTTIAFDGVNVISPGGRTARLDTIPSAIASQVVARKAITAAMPSETLAGNIDIITRSPFDYEGLKFGADAGIGYNDLGGGKQQNWGAFISNKFADDRWGALLSVSKYSRDMVTDNFESDPEVASEDREPGGSERVWFDAHQNKLYRLTRENESVSGRLEFRPSDDHRFFLSSIYTEFSDHELRNAMEFDLDANAVRTSDTRPQSEAQRTGYADVRTGNTPWLGTVHGVEMDSTLNIGNTVQSIFTTTLGGDQDFDAWRASWRLNYTEAEQESGPSFNSTWVSPSERTLRPTVDYDFTNRELHRVTLWETIRNADGSFSKGDLKRSLDSHDYNFVNLRSNTGLAVTDAYSARMDLFRDTTLFGRPTELQFGMQYDDRSKENNQARFEVTAAQLAAMGIAQPTMADFASDKPYQGALPLGYSFRYHDEGKAWGLLDGLRAQGAGGMVGSVAFDEWYEVSEKIGAVYGMATTRFDWGNMVAGVRGEYTRNASSAYAGDDNGYERITVSESGVEFFPSVHINWDLNDEMKLRFSANTGAARPDYTDLRPNFAINDEEGEIDGGNPYADTEKSVGVDAYFEWYMRPQGFFSAGVYYKNLRDVLFDVEIPRFGQNVLDRPGFDRSEYTYFTLANGGDGYIRGLELAYSQKFGPLAERFDLPLWVGDFGISANVTFNDSEATTPDGRDVSLPGASDLIYNTSLYYEANGLSARLSWQYRDAWVDSIGSGDILGDAYWDEVSRLDFSLRYAFNDNVEMYFDANNLLDEAGIRYQGDRQRTTEFEQFGARYMVGVRLNF
ncbi:TonB-dependent receptor [Luteimonas sp. MC1825]|uniref:TonB-dependent receptor n=1 Tax=Luteimonas sp. MC1825 TaxID=2761107 RepID=UPI001622BC0E|nr:TonB-dependent receptor [Luteimonas sp. MC1825]MBB6600284.1 TonB-dependent receptor [Luteimonas sp. MC1825]QOC87965.1 TonB-dependent receptor [Luteimonas sp. MC1825]